MYIVGAVEIVLVCSSEFYMDFRTGRLAQENFHMNLSINES